MERHFRFHDFAKWITLVPSDQLLARCKCCKGINLNNMGIQALKSYCRETKYLKLIATMCNIKTVTSFTTGSQDLAPKPDSTAKVSEVPTCSKKRTLEKSPSIGFCLLKDDVTKAEIGWYMRAIKKN